MLVAANFVIKLLELTTSTISYQRLLYYGSLPHEGSEFESPKTAVSFSNGIKLIDVTAKYYFYSLPAVKNVSLW